MKLTGVGGTFCASHNSPEGVLHGHSYEVIAWFRAGDDARSLQTSLSVVLAQYDHTHLAPKIAWAEEIAETIAHQLPGCVEVEVNRPLERFYARWRM